MSSSFTTRVARLAVAVLVGFGAIVVGTVGPAQAVEASCDITDSSPGVSVQKLGAGWAPMAVGTAGDDVIVVHSGCGWVSGGDGNDRIVVRNRSVVFGGLGNDRICTVNWEHNLVDAGPGRDYLTADPDDDYESVTLINTMCPRNVAVLWPYD